MTDNENFQLDEDFRVDEKPGPLGAVPEAQPLRSRLSEANRRTVIIGGAVVAVVIAAIIAFAVGGKDPKSSNGADNGAAPSNATTISVADLTAESLGGAVAAVKREVYWVGPEDGYTYVLSGKGDGQSMLTYVPAGADPNAGGAVYRMVGTYPILDAFTVTTRAADDGVSTLINNADGSIVLYNKARPSNVYVAFPGVDVQIEIYDPNGKALELATSGKVVRVG